MLSVSKEREMPALLQSWICPTFILAEAGPDLRFSRLTLPGTMTWAYPVSPRTDSVNDHAETLSPIGRSSLLRSRVTTSAWNSNQLTPLQGRAGCDRRGAVPRDRFQSCSTTTWLRPNQAAGRGQEESLRQQVEAGNRGGRDLLFADRDGADAWRRSVGVPGAGGEGRHRHARHGHAASSG